MRGTGSWLKTQQRLNFLFLLAGLRASGHCFLFWEGLWPEFLSTQLKPSNEAMISRQRKGNSFSWLSDEVAPWWYSPGDGVVPKTSG